MENKNLEQEFVLYSRLTELSNFLKDDMVTPADIAVATRTLSTTIDVLKKCSQLAEKYNDIEIKEVILELRNQLADTKSTLIDTKEEINSLKEENNNLKEQLENKDKVYFFKGAYYRKEDQDKSQPFCMTCYESKKKLITLRALGSKHPGIGSSGNMRCNDCKSYSQVD